MEFVRTLQHLETSGMPEPKWLRLIYIRKVLFLALSANYQGGSKGPAGKNMMTSHKSGQANRLDVERRSTREEHILLELPLELRKGAILHK